MGLFFKNGFFFFFVNGVLFCITRCCIGDFLRCDDVWDEWGWDYYIWGVLGTRRVLMMFRFSLRVLDYSCVSNPNIPHLLNRTPQEWYIKNTLILFIIMIRAYIHLYVHYRKESESDWQRVKWDIHIAVKKKSYPNP